MMKHYILKDGNPVEEPDLLTWARWFEAHDTERRVAFTELEACQVSTVFLGLDHSFGGSVPVLYETLIFGGPHDGEGERYATKEEAIAGHERYVAIAKKPPVV